MGNSASSSDSDDDFNVDYKEEDAISDAENELEKDVQPNLDLSSLFDHVSLRTAASKVKDEIPENVLQQHSGHLIRWLEERQQRNEEVVTLSQFYDVLMNRKVERDDCIKAFQQFDAEGDGSADVSTMLEVLKSSSGVDLSGDLRHVVRTLQACSLTPGFIDVYSDDKATVGQHGTRILNFLLRNRAASNTLPFPILNGFKNTTTMREAALNSQFTKLKENVISRQQEDNLVGAGEELKPLTKCWSSIEVSSSKADASKLTNGDTSSYWQSDGSARSHWIRLRVKSNVVIKQLSISVASTDQSYMPQVAAVSVGKNPHSLKEIKEVRIASHITGDVILLENAKIYYPVVQINIKRCHSDGCDARIHSIKTLGFRVIKDSGISVLDAAASWYLQVLASTATAALPNSPQLHGQILAHSRTALRYMPPLSLCPASADKPAFLSQHVLGQMDSFLQDIAGKEGETTAEGLEVLLGFSVARGSITGIVKTLLHLQRNLNMELTCGQLLWCMETVKDGFWKKQGQALTLTLAGTDGGQKDEISSPQNVLTRNWSTAQPYLSGDGNTKVNMFFQCTDSIQLTKIRLKVDKGPRGPKTGMVFVYNATGPFVLEKHVQRLKMYDTWNYCHYAFCNKVTSMGLTLKEENPVAYFSVEDDWDEVEIPIDHCAVGQYVCIKFLEPRQNSSERLGIVGIKFYGFNRRSVFIDSIRTDKNNAAALVDGQEKYTNDVIILRVLSFLVALARDQAAPKKGSPISKPQHLDTGSTSIALIWKLYEGFGENIYCKNLTLQLLHALFPFVSDSQAVPDASDREVTEQFFKALCKVVDQQDELEENTEKLIVVENTKLNKNKDNSITNRSADAVDSKNHTSSKNDGNKKNADNTVSSSTDNKDLVVDNDNKEKASTSNTDSSDNTVTSTTSDNKAVSELSSENAEKGDLEDLSDDKVVVDGIYMSPNENMDLETKVKWMEERSRALAGRDVLNEPRFGTRDELMMRVLGQKPYDKSTIDKRKKEMLENDEDPSTKLAMEVLLAKVAKQVIVDGAAVFFPDKEARSKQLFTMMTDVNGSKEALSVMLTFQSLCQFFSSVDPSGLLDLPSMLESDYDPTPSLAVMETLISVAFREFKTILDKKRANDQSEHLVHLLCSLQTSLLSWCFKMIGSCSEQKDLCNTVQNMVASYIELLVNKSMTALKMVEEIASLSSDTTQSTSQLKKQESGENNDTQDTETLPEHAQENLECILENIASSFLGTSVPQAMLVISHMGVQLSGPVRIKIIKSCMSLTKRVKQLATWLPKMFYGPDSTHWQQMESGEMVLRTWEVESTHNYENNQHVTQIFSCPGATLFMVEFDPRCETEKRYDYLEFTDSRGSKTRYDQKVATTKWPATVTFTGGHKLQFVFHSDSSNNEWGYKFKVIAKGCPDVPLHWLFDLHLSMAKLYGRICGTTLDVSKVLPKPKATPDTTEDAELELLKSELWTTLFRGGYRAGSTQQLQRSLSGKCVTEDDSMIVSFIMELIQGEGELAQHFLEKCKEHCIKQPQLAEASEEINSTTAAVFGALLWHTQSLREEVKKYVTMGSIDGAGGEHRFSDGIYQAFSTAESLRTYLLDQKQKQVIASEKAGSKEVSYDPVSVCKEKAHFLLKFSGLTKVHLKPESKNKLDRKSSKLYRMPSLTTSDRYYRLDIAMEKYPSFKLVMDFVRDPAWSKARVEQLLEERCEHAQTVADVYMFSAEYLRIMSHKHVFQVPNIVFLQEFFSHQSLFAKHYAEGIEGCGLELESQVRLAYYTLARRLVDSVKNTSKINMSRNVTMCYNYLQTCVLHLLDINWQPYDLEFVEDLKLPQFYMQLAKASVSMREKVSGEIDEKTELEEYKRNMAWLEECKKEFFKWYESQNSDNKGSDNRKSVQMFVARFCDLLDVEISCDGCGTTLPGRRYRCLQCSDMDLCSPCYAGGVKPGGDHTDDHEIVHLMYKCDECQAFIVGTRIHCEVCEDFDLCLGCQHEGQFPACHNAQHGVMRIPITKLKLNKQADSFLLSYIHQHVWLCFVSMALSMADILYHTTQQGGVGVRKHTMGLDHDYIKVATQIHNQCIQLANQCLHHVSLEKDEIDDSAESIKARQEEAFAMHSQERVLGLLGAMIPAENKTALEDDLSFTFTSEEFMAQLFAIARGETGHEENTQHFAMGLIGQLLQKAATLCHVVDSALSTDSENEEMSLELVGKPEGYKTAKFLFNFGAVCLERSGLEWSNSMANILQKLFNVPAWREVLLVHLSECIHRVRRNPELSSIFALFVIAGFPEVLSVGSQVKYTDLGTEFRRGVVLKHFPDKNQTLLVDLRNRKRRLIKDDVIECVSHDIQVLERGHLVDFIQVIKDITNKLKRNPQDEAVESIWVLSLCLKALLKALGQGGLAGSHRVGGRSTSITKEGVSEDDDTDDSSNTTVQELYTPNFLQCIVHLASQGTSFSRQWLLKDLEILSLTLYTKDKEKDTDVKNGGGVAVKTPLVSHKQPAAETSSKKEDECDQDTESLEGAVGGPPRPPPLTTSPSLVEAIKKEGSSVDPELDDPWEGIDETARLCFKTLEEHLKIPVPVLRAIYDMHGKSTNALLMAVHENIEGEKFEASQEIMELAKKWENGEAEKVEPGLEAVVVDRAVDTGMQLVEYPDLQHRTVDVATEEPSEDTQKLITTADNDIKKDTSRQRKLRSATLLKKEQETQGKSGSRKFLAKINTAMAVLYARQVLASLLADWPDEGHMITGDLLGCKKNNDVPFVLDLLNRVETKDLFQKVVQNVIKYCEMDSLVPIASTSCQFMEEINLSTITKESKHNYDNNTKYEDKVHIPGATHLSVKFDSRCCTEEACDELTLVSTPDFKQDKHLFSGNREKWIDFDMPGDTLHMKFASDVSNNDWGYKFTVSGGKIGRFDTGYMILNGVLSVQSVISKLYLPELWQCLVYVACKQTGQHRLKALQLLLKIMMSQFKEHGRTSLQIDLTLLRPLWKLYNTMSELQEAHSCSIVQPVIRALTELFLVAENLALDWDIVDMYVACLQSDLELRRTVVFQGLRNVAAISTVINYKNKATLAFEILKEKLKEAERKQAKAGAAKSSSSGTGSKPAGNANTGSATNNSNFVVALDIDSDDTLL